mmetsp:Transcript_49717/g.75095  ORF Transcript_49717/g.75095 Transcript_49717/m.75095 type:complete len:157 (-) Transcript_49717:1384-1854(-)
MARKKRHSIFPPHPHSLPTPLLFPHTLHPFFKRGRFIRWAEAGFERESIYKRRISIEVHCIVPPYADDDSDDKSDDEDGKHDAGRSQKVKPVEEACIFHSKEQSNHAYQYAQTTCKKQTCQYKRRNNNSSTFLSSPSRTRKNKSRNNVKSNETQCD